MVVLLGVAEIKELAAIVKPLLYGACISRLEEIATEHEVGKTLLLWFENRVFKNLK